MANKVFVIGLDGATFDIILPLVERGDLPTFKKLMDEGSWGNLESTIPYLTPPAWTSSVTGVNPGKHNIFEFFKRNESFDSLAVNSTDRHCPAIWNVLSDHGKVVGVFNVPITYPPEPVNGFMITGMGTPLRSKDFVYPVNLKDEIEEIEKEFSKGYLSLCVDHAYLNKGDEQGFLYELYDITRRQERILRYLYNKFRPDFVMTVFDELDRLQHFFWRYMDKEHILYDPGKPDQIKMAIFDYYKLLDEIIGRLVSTLGDDTTVVIYSDHGFGPLEKEVYINQFLKKKRLLKTKFKIEMRLLMKGVLNRIFKNKFIIWEDGLNTRIDWTRTKAYMDALAGQSIKINQKGNEKYTRESTYHDVIDALLSLKDPSTGETIIINIHKREDIYSGPYVPNAPDLFLECKDGYWLSLGFKKELVSITGYYSSFGSELSKLAVIRSGEHRREGIAIFWGKPIRCSKIEKMDIVDITPTLMYILGLKIPDYVDGRVVEEIFEPDFIKKRPIEFTSEEFGACVNEPRDYSSKEAREVTERLKGLGYL